MTTPASYLLDSDVLITAKNLYYAFDICPGFWQGLIDAHLQGRVFSIDRVRNELLVGRKTEDLVRWVSAQLPATFFLEGDQEEVATVYTDIMLWAQRHPRYFDYAKAKFATGADGWLVAYAKFHGFIVVTNEQPAPESKKDIKLPDVCSQFDVKYTDTFHMLRDLGVRLDLRGTPS